MIKLTLLQAWSFCVDNIPGVKQEQADDVYNEIIKAYSNDNRMYHTSEHLLNMINSIQEMLCIYNFKDFPEKKAILFLATFFHDLYMNFDADSPRGKSEHESASMATTLMMHMGISKYTILNSVNHLILLTINHMTDDSMSPDILMQKIFLDADIAILGAEPHKYDTYKDGISYEYAQVDREIFIASRRNFLQQYTEKKAIFYTEYMNQLYLDQVMDNIKCELKELDREYAELLINQTQ